MSRREADDAVASGRVTINGVRAQMGSQVAPTDSVALDSTILCKKTQYTYLVLHKPVGYVCSRRRQGDIPTIYELLPEQYRALKPVGRLDKDSSGILLLTDDGDFAHSMTHPKFYKTKIYEVELDHPLAPLHQQMVSDFGVTLEDGVSRFLIEKLEGRKKKDEGREGADGHDARVKSQESRVKKSTELNGSGQTYKITMHEGRNRQIRRTFAALGYTVTHLHRTTFGNYSLGDIKTGEHALVDIR